MLDIAPLSLNQYQRMIEAGILGENEPIEMMDGYLVSRDRGLGFDWPADTMPLDVPRLGGIAPLWPLSLDQYHGMIEAGIVDEDDPIELMDGYLILKDQGRGPGMGHGPTHALGVDQVQDRLRSELGGG
jgi:hypothetical protein